MTRDSDKESVRRYKRLPAATGAPSPGNSKFVEKRGT
jgi:hypothetical protein